MQLGARQGAALGQQHQHAPCTPLRPGSVAAPPHRPRRPRLSTSCPASQSPFAPQPAARSPPAAPPLASEQRPWTEKTFLWRGHRINFATAGCGRPILLCHGFGASLGHYRKTIPWLAQHGFKVYAIDLLGFGKSDKPVQQYTIETWAELIVDFLAEWCGGASAVVVGNSIGSLSCLAAAAAAPPGALAGLVLLNSAGAMNNKGVVSDWRIVLAYPLLLAIDAALRTRPIAQRLFGALAQPETVRKVLSGVYVDQAAVDDELVDIILAPAFTPNALDVFTSVITGPPGPKPWDLVPRLEPELPLFVAWGSDDPFTPLDGPVGKYFEALAQQRAGSEFALLPGVGHCPQDDRPEALHARLLPWLRGLPAWAPAAARQQA